MKFIIPVEMNTTYPYRPIEFGIQDDTSEKEERTVTLFVRGTDPESQYEGTYATVKASDLLKALEWLKRWA